MEIILLFFLHLGNQNIMLHGKLCYHFGHLSDLDAFLQNLLCRSFKRLNFLRVPTHCRNTIAFDVQKRATIKILYT